MNMNHNHETDNEEKSDMGSSQDVYTKLTDLARKCNSIQQDTSAPQYFAARVAALAIAERQQRKRAVASPWDIVGWRALATAGLVALAAFVVSDPDFMMSTLGASEVTLFSDDSVLFQTSPLVPFEFM